MKYKVTQKVTWRNDPYNYSFEDLDAAMCELFLALTDPETVKVTFKAKGN